MVAVSPFELDLAKLRSYAVRLTGHRDDAQDLLHDTLVRYLTARTPEAEIENTTAWLHTIMRNTWFNARRATKAKESLPKGYERGVVDEWCVDSTIVERDMRRAMDSLPKNLQDVVHAHVVEEGSSERVGRRLGISRVTARTRMQDARRALRSRLETNEAWA